MITTTATFNMYNNSEARAPRWILEFDGISGTKFSSGGFSGISATYKQYITSVRVSSQVKNFIGASGGKTYAEIVLLDDSREVTNFVSNNNLVGLKSILYYGFEELTTTDFVKRIVGKIREVNYRSFSEIEIILEDYFPIAGDFILKTISENELSSQIAGSYFVSALSSNIGTGTQVATIDNDPLGLEKGDTIYLFKGATSETATLGNVDVNNQQVTINSLANSYATGATLNTSRIPLVSATNFETSVPANPPFADGLFVKIGQEIIRYDSVNTTLNHLLISGESDRNRFGSAHTRHAANAKVTECFVLRDNPIDLILQWLTTTSAGTNGDYDLGIANYGLGLDASLVNQGEWEQIKNSEFNDPSDQFQFVLSGRQDAADLILKQTCAPLGIMVYIDGEGQISPRRLATITASDSQQSLTNNDVSAVPPNYNAENVLNKVEFHYAWEDGLSQFKKVRLYELTESISTYGPSQPLIIQSKGMRNSYNAQTFIDSLLPVLAKRYGNPPVTVKADVHNRHYVLEAGDIIDLTLDSYPNLATGTLGFSNELGQLMRIEVNSDSAGTVEMELSNQMDFVNVGISVEVDTGDIDATTNSTSTANFNATNSDVVQADDAKYDNSEGANQSATRVIVSVRAVIDTFGDSVTVTARVGTGVDGSPMTTQDSQQITQVGKPIGVYNLVFTFDGLSNSVWDVKVDYHAQSGSAPPSAVTIDYIKYETDGAAYTEIT